MPWAPRQAGLRRPAPADRARCLHRRGAPPPQGPARQCSTDWQTVASDPFGWLNPPQGREESEHRFTKAPAPDGSMAIQHSIRTSDVVWSLGYDSPVFDPTPGYIAARLRYRMWIEEGAL